MLKKDGKGDDKTTVRLVGEKSVKNLKVVKIIFERPLLSINWLLDKL